MQISRTFSLRHTLLLVGVLLPSALSFAWDYEGHRAINRIALAALPAEFPDFVHDSANAERIAWLAGEADRWRSSPDLPARHCNAPDHYLDFEHLALAGLDPATISSFRYEFAVQYAQGRAAHPESNTTTDPEKNADRTRDWAGFLPWTITEYFGKLRGNFARLKVLEELGTPEELAQAKASIVEMMGVMGHFVGDAAQPLHNTMHHNGWVGANPHKYSTWRGFHSWIDSGFINKTQINLRRLPARAQPARLLSLDALGDGRDPMIQHVITYLQAQAALVEPLYQMEKDGLLKADRDPVSPEAVAFIERQMLVAGQMLADIWLTAWRSAAPDPFLRGQLVRQKAGPANKSAPAPKKTK